jgi:uncharacterized protein
MDDAIANRLEQRLGRLHAKQRLGIERDHEAQIFGQGLNFFHIEKWYSIHYSFAYPRCAQIGRDFLARSEECGTCPGATQLYSPPKAPPAFNGFTLLHISDLHVDMKGATFGPFDDALEGMKRLRSHLRKTVYGVLGNHDTIRMVPGLEDMGIRILLNECEPVSRGGASIYLAGIDDAHYYRVDKIEKAVSAIPPDAFSILLSHTPEVYRHAAHAGFDLLLSGHTHGGQICLPGSIPITLSSVLPRQFRIGSLEVS